MNLSSTILGQSIEGARQFKSCLYVIGKRYKQEVANILMGILRYLSGNNAPMMAAFQRIREKKILCLLEKIALETGFYSMFRQIIENSSSLIKDPSVKATKLNTGVFEYSRQIFMSIFDLSTKICSLTPVVKALEFSEIFNESDFVCPYSMKQIEHPVEIKLDNGESRVIIIFKFI